MFEKGTLKINSPTNRQWKQFKKSSVVRAEFQITNHQRVKIHSIETFLFVHFFFFVVLGYSCHSVYSQYIMFQQSFNAFKRVPSQWASESQTHRNSIYSLPGRHSAARRETAGPLRSISSCTGGPMGDKFNSYQKPTGKTPSTCCPRTNTF